MKKLQSFQNSFFWNGTDYCDKYNGVGFCGKVVVNKDYQVDKYHYLYRRCMEVGCSHCKNGIIDWVTNTMNWRLEDD